MNLKSTTQSSLMEQCQNVSPNLTVEITNSDVEKDDNDRNRYAGALPSAFLCPLFLLICHEPRDADLSPLTRAQSQRA